MRRHSGAVESTNRFPDPENRLEPMRISLILAPDDEILEAVRQRGAAFQCNAREHVLDADAGETSRGLRAVDLDADLVQAGGSDTREEVFGIDQNPVAIEDQESHGAVIA